MQLWQGSSSEGEPEPPSPEVARELKNICECFTTDEGAVHLLRHERQQLKRIRVLARRDGRATLSHLRIFKRRALAARRALQSGKAA